MAKSLNFSIESENDEININFLVNNEALFS